MGSGRAITLAVMSLAGIVGLMSGTLLFMAPSGGIALNDKRQPASLRGASEPREDTQNWSQKASVAVGAMEVVVGGFIMLWSAGLVRARTRTTRVVRRGTAMGTAISKMGPVDVASEAGVSAPYGEPGVSYWDPAGLADNIDESTFRQYRTAELKHGRVAMMAVLGFVVQHSSRFDLVYPYDSSIAPESNLNLVPSGAAAMWTYPSSGFFGILVLVSGLHEVIFTDKDRDPGDFGDPFKFAEFYGLDWSTDDKKQYQTYELNHGRLAMSGAIGTLLAEYVTGLDGVQQWEQFGRGVERTFALTIPNGPVPPF